MIDIDFIIKEISKESKIDEDIVDTVCKHVFKETVKIMKDDSDCKDILFRGLFKFKLKPRYKNNKSLNYTSK